jgi:sulfur relay (sulfurtransferase) DsrC/TusE family protein
MRPSNEISEKIKNKNIQEIYNKGLWSSTEQDRFKEALFYFGKNIKDLHSYIKSRSLVQIKAHLQKFFKSLKSKFNKELDKQINKNENLDIEEFALSWTNNFIDNFFKILDDCPPSNNFVKKNIKELEKKENYDRFKKIILQSIFKKFPSKNDKPIKKVIHKCSCNCHEKETACDCFDDCCEGEEDDINRKNKNYHENSNLEEISLLAKKNFSESINQVNFKKENFDNTINHEDKSIGDSNTKSDYDYKNKIFDLNNTENFDIFPSLRLFKSEEFSQISNFDYFNNELSH